MPGIFNNLSTIRRTIVFAEKWQEEAITKLKLEVAKPQIATKNSSDRVPVMGFWNTNDLE